MNNKKKRRNSNFGVKSISIPYYLNSYFNPKFSKELQEFYWTYFGDNTHESFESKLENLRKILKEGSNDSRINQVISCFENEINSLCDTARPLYFGRVKECDILTGEVVSVKDVCGEKKYYPTYQPSLEEFETFVSNDVKRLQLHRFH